MHSVREFSELAFSEIGRRIEWAGEGVDEVGRCAATGELLVVVDRQMFRPAEVDLLLGNPEKARIKLGWFHEKSISDLVSDMVRADIERQTSIRAGNLALEDFL